MILEYSFLFQWCKKYKNRPRNARVIWYSYQAVTPRTPYCLSSAPQLVLQLLSVNDKDVSDRQLCIFHSCMFIYSALKSVYSACLKARS